MYYISSPYSKETFFSWGFKFLMSDFQTQSINETWVETNQKMNAIKNHVKMVCDINLGKLYYIYHKCHFICCSKRWWQSPLENFVQELSAIFYVLIVPCNSLPVTTLCFSTSNCIYYVFLSTQLKTYHSWLPVFYFLIVLISTFYSLDFFWDIFFGFTMKHLHFFKIFCIYDWVHSVSFYIANKPENPEDFF